MSWRPKSAWEVVLSDAELAKLGLVVALEAQAKMAILTALKAPAKLSHGEWVARERRQVVQLTDELLHIAKSLDDELWNRVAEFKALLGQSHELRHKLAHANWGHDGDRGGIGARDIRRSEMLKPPELDSAVAAMGELSVAAKQCAARAAELIVEGVLSASDPNDPGPWFHARGRWVKL